MHKKQYTFVSGASDNIKKWQFPEGKFMQNLSGEEQRGTERDEEDNHNCVLCAVCGVLLLNTNVFLSLVALFYREAMAQY